MSVSADLTSSQSRVFSAGWIFLSISSALMTLNHFVLTFVLTEPVLFLGWTAFNLYALLVIAIPFRRLERWAWYATWILPVGLTAGAFFAPDIALFYYSVSAVCALGLLLTMRSFFTVEQ
jgi:hypothetical protein